VRRVEARENIWRGLALPLGGTLFFSQTNGMIELLSMLNKRVGINVGWDLLVIGLVLLLFLCVASEGLDVDASLFVLSPIGVDAQTAEQNRSTLLPILIEREATDRALIESSIDGQREFRGFYILIVSGLLTLVFDEKRRQNVLLLIFGVILGMYFLDVHFEDLQARQKAGQRITEQAILRLANTPPLDTIKYTLSYDAFHSSMDKAVGRSFVRKLYLATHPTNIERIIFYLLPLAIIYVCATRLRWKQRAT